MTDFQVNLTLTFGSKVKLNVISVIINFRCNLLAISNHYAKIDHPPSKIAKLYDLDILLQCHIDAFNP